MDNLTHSLVGAALARTRLGRLSPYATPALIVAANLPDLDIFVRLWGGRAGYLEHHRGVTHGILGVLLQAVGLALLLRLFERRRARRRAEPERGSLGGALLLALAGLATHPLLDYLNVYGLRPWLPFDPRWVYGDALFILDPWLWLTLGAAALLGGAGSRAGSVAWTALFALCAVLVGLAVRAGLAPLAASLLWAGATAVLLLARWRGWGREHRTAMLRASFAAAGVYLALAFALSAHAKQVGLQYFAQRVPGAPGVRASSASPLPLDPRLWTVFVETDTEVHLLDLELDGELLSHRRLQRMPDDALVLRAQAAECAAAWRGFVRYPHAALRATAEGSAVELMDARYQLDSTLAEDAQGTWASAVVEFSPAGDLRCP